MKNMLVFVALIILCVSCGVENDADWDAGDVAGDVEELTNCGEVYGCGNNVPLYYSTEGVDVEVSMVDAPFGFTAEKLMAMADECGTTYEPGYFEALVKTFTDTDIGGVKLQFVFRYEGESQDSDSFVVTLLQNYPGYKSMEEFQKDFALCYAGGDAYPMMFNSHWLLFENSCSTGFNDGSGLPIGCQEVKDIVSPSLKLN